MQLLSNIPNGLSANATMAGLTYKAQPKIQFVTTCQPIDSYERIQNGTFTLFRVKVHPIVNPWSIAIIANQSASSSSAHAIHPFIHIINCTMRCASFHCQTGWQTTRQGLISISLLLLINWLAHVLFLWPRFFTHFVTYEIVSFFHFGLLIPTTMALSAFPLFLDFGF